MSHPLDGCWAKIQRAKEQINNLNIEITSLLNNDAYSVVGEFQPERQRYVFKIVGPPVPLRIAVLAGEIIHHLRSCFDHVVWALASKNGIPDETRITFPVCETAEKYKNAVKEGIIKGVSRAERPLIEALQPYQTNDPANSILKIIHDLDIADKHRLLIVVANTAIRGNMIHITPPSESSFSWGAVRGLSRTVKRYTGSICEGTPAPSLSRRSERRSRIVTPHILYTVKSAALGPQHERNSAR
jgi:hypothetical protein